MLSGNLHVRTCVCLSVHACPYAYALMFTWQNLCGSLDSVLHSKGLAECAFAYMCICACAYACMCQCVTFGKVCMAVYALVCLCVCAYMHRADCVHLGRPCAYMHLGRLSAGHASVYRADCVHTRISADYVHIGQTVCIHAQGRLSAYSLDTVWHWDRKPLMQLYFV